MTHEHQLLNISEILSQLWHNWWPESDHGGIIYSTETGKHYKTGYSLNNYLVTDLPNDIAYNKMVIMFPCIT